VHMHMHVGMCACIHNQTRIHARMHARTHTQTHNVHTYTHTCTHVDTETCRHIDMQTHRHVPSDTVYQYVTLSEIDLMFLLVRVLVSDCGVDTQLIVTCTRAAFAGQIPCALCIYIYIYIYIYI